MTASGVDVAPPITQRPPPSVWCSGARNSCVCSGSAALRYSIHAGRGSDDTFVCSPPGTSSAKTVPDGGARACIDASDTSAGTGAPESVGPTVYTCGLWPAAANRLLSTASGGAGAICSVAVANPGSVTGATHTARVPNVVRTITGVTVALAASPSYAYHSTLGCV